FFLLSGLLFLLFSEKRALLRTPYPYLAAGVSLVVFLPVIVWNAQHDWVTLRHTAGQAHIASGLQLTPQAFAEFLGSQIGAVTPILFVLTIPALFIKHLLKKDVRHQFLFWFGVPIIVFFLAKSLQAKVQPNWAMTGYITALAAVCTAAFGGYGLPEKTRERLRRFFHIGFALALLATVAAHVVPATTLLPVKLDPSARLRGWQQMGAQVGAIEKMLTEQGGVLIFSDSYQVASELAFYVPTHPKTYCINNGRRMNQYDFWPDMNSAAETLKRTGVQAINGIYVAAGNATLPQSVAGAFERFEKRVIPVYDKGQRPLREYSVFICYGFRGLAAVRPTTF
ncbi:MAG TPA: hypothetical protein VK445_07340, partial [Dissulfurispiraceae bacterium]|nr:hypothetical protein [Dissulfurispiraceae bacterium]